MTQYNKAILSAAEQYLGLEEWPGAKDNPRIVEMFGNVGHDWVEDDETPWCAAFVGSVLGGLSLPHTGKLNARSYEDYGTKVPLSGAMPGDIVVLWRGSKTSWQGHVAFFVKWDGDYAILRGGNQGNKVSDARYPKDRIVAIRRADGAMPKGSRPVLREGDSGAYVIELQTKLAKLGYTPGRIDGDFGAETAGETIKFQAHNGLTKDAVVGKETWAALDTARPRPMRHVNVETLEKNSETMKNAEEGKKGIKIGGATLGLGTLVTQADELSILVDQAASFSDKLAGIAPSLLLGLAVVGVVWYGINRWNKAKEIRVRDAMTGANTRI